MVAVTVFVILLENLPEFENVLNFTLYSKSKDISRTVSRCNYESDIMWQLVNKNGILIKNHKLYHSHKSSLEDSIAEIDTNFISKTEIPKILMDDYYLAAKNVSGSDERKIYKKEGNDIYPNAVPPLVAIFEIRMNITAQTCGGTLLSSNWVVTISSCLDVLSSNDLNETHLTKINSHYSIVANATNPFEEGTVHKVTEIILQPKFNASLKTRSYESFSSGLALMKIEPGVTYTSTSIFKDPVTKDMNLRVYGWLLNESANGQEIIIGSFPAKKSDLHECEISHKLINRSSTICLYANESCAVSEMSSGGPVMLFREDEIQLVGIAQLETRSHFVVYPFSSHYKWLSEIIKK